MQKLSIEEIVKLERLKNIRLVCWCMGAVSLMLAFSTFPLATRNPGAMATSAFSAFVEAAQLSWMVLPTLILGIVFVICGLVVNWKIKRQFDRQSK